MVKALVQPKQERRLLGIALVIAAFGCFALLDSAVKLLSDTISVSVLIFFRSIMQFVLTLIIFLPKDGRHMFYTKKPLLQFLRALGLFLTTLFNFMALVYLPLSVTTALFFTAPLFVCALSVPLLGERVGPRRWTAILISLIGVLIVIRPGTDAVHWAVIFSVGAAVSLAFYTIFTRMLAGVATTQSQQVYTALLSVLIIAPIAFTQWSWEAINEQWLILISMGIIGTIAHHILITAHRYAPASTLAPFVYSQILYIGLIDIIVFDLVPDRYMITGAVIIALSGLYLWFREREISDTKKRAEKP